MRTIILLLFFLSTNLFSQTFKTVKNGSYDDPNVWDQGSAPNSSSYVQISHSVTVTGDAYASSASVYTGGNLFLSSGATFHVSGMDLSGGTLNASSGTIDLYGSGYHYLSGKGFTMYNLVNNGGNVEIWDPITVTHELKISNGSYLFTGKGIDLNLMPGAQVTGSFGQTRMLILSRAGGGYASVKQYVTSTSGEISLPIGSYEQSSSGNTYYYSPITIRFNASSTPSSNAHFLIQTMREKHPNNSSSTNYLKRYYSISGTGISNVNMAVTATYATEDVVGTESDIYGGYYQGGNWTSLGKVNTSSHQITGSISYSSSSSSEASLGKVNSSINQITSTVDHFYDITGGEANAMPVELVSFTVSYNGRAIILNWETATEVNNYGFEVEKQSSTEKNFNINSDENKNKWQKIGFVEGGGNRNAPKKYSFVDNNVSSQTDVVYYYRLRQIDNDGAISYSQIRSITIDQAPKGYFLSQNYPNPFNPTTEIKFSTAKREKVQLKIFDAVGQELETIFEGVVEPNKVTKVNFNASKYSSGVYYYKLITPEWTSSKKMILMK